MVLIRQAGYKTVKPFFSTFAVLGVVLLNLCGAVLMDWTAGNVSILSLGFVTVLITVIFLNILRFILWRFVHKIVDLSRSFVLTSLFFPLVALIAFLQGEMISLLQWFGVLIICFGVFWISAFTHNTNGIMNESSVQKGSG